MKRHKYKIHTKEKLHFCCGKTFHTKGVYYVHCEQSHPDTRLYTIVSRNKYKITGDRLPFDHGPAPSLEEQADNLHRMLMRLRSESSDKVVSKQLKTKLSLEYSCSEVDIENIPLMSFLTDHRLTSCFERSCSREEQPTDEQKEQKTTNRMVKIAISPEQEIQKTVSEENMRTKLSDSSSISLELPVKKLILHWFKRSRPLCRKKKYRQPGWPRESLTEQLIRGGTDDSGAKMDEDIKAASCSRG